MNILPKSLEAEKEQSPPGHLEIPTHKEVFVGELAERGDWIVAIIQTGLCWPANAQKVMYRGCAFWIIPVMRDYYPAVARPKPVRLTETSASPKIRNSPRTVPESGSGTTVATNRI